MDDQIPKKNKRRASELRFLELKKLEIPEIDKLPSACTQLQITAKLTIQSVRILYVKSKVFK